MIKAPKLSIILPVYNTEKYLAKCLESILNNTFKDYELIVINDGTKDNSEKIILEYKEKFGDKLIYISKENTGLSDTRNVGISTAKGEYITFVDSDDYIETEMYEKMFEKISKKDYDVVACNIKLVYEKSDNIGIVSSGYNTDIEDKNKIKETMIVQYPAVWNKIYKSELVKNHTFSKGVWYEDMEFVLKLYPHIKSIGAVDKALYDYLQRENSITYTYNDKLYDIINNMTNVIEYYKENGFFKEYKEELEYLYTRYAFATFPKRMAKCKDKKKYMEGITYAMNKVKENFPEYKKNKYLEKTGLKGKYIKHFGRVLANINYMVQNISKYN